MSIRFQVFVCHLVLAFFLASIQASATEDTGESAMESDWVVQENTLLQGEHKSVLGDVVVEPGVILRVEGSDLRVGGKILIREGATMELAPHQERPATLGPHESGEGFWIQVEGELVSSGDPRTVIHGLAGNGLDALFDYTGGIQIQGTARLEDVAITDGNAGLVVQEGATLHLRNATVENLNEVGIGVFGRALLEHTTVRNHTLITIAGRATCDISIRHSLLDSVRDGLVANSCRAELHDTVILNSGVGLTANGSAWVTLTESRIEGYRVDGISSSSQPEKPLPRIHLEDVTLVPGPTGQRGLELMNVGEVVLRNVHIEGNELVGIQSSRTDLLQVESSTIHRNGGYGIQAAGGHLDVDLETTTFGSRDDGTSNEAGAIQYHALLRAVAQDPRGDRVEGYRLQVFDRGGLPVFNGTDQAGTALASFLPYLDKPDGPFYRGPFTYHATHKDTGEVLEGSLASLDDDLVLRFDSMDPQASTIGFGPIVLIGSLLLGAVILQVVARDRKNRSRE